MLVTAGGIGAMGEACADARGPSVGGGESQGVPAEHVVFGVDASVGVDEFVDDVEALVVDGHDQGAQPRLKRCV